MRTIIFRGLEKNTNEWIYGNLVDSGLVRKKEFFILKNDADNYDEIEKVFPESVGQFTGLKDKNRVDIYDGDIIDGNTFSGKKLKCKVVYDENYGCYQLTSFKEKSLTFPIKSFIKDLEVIGNIHENPELLAVPTAVL